MDLKHVQKMFENGDIRESLKSLQELLKDSPNNKQIMYWIGRCFEELKELPKCRDAYKKSQDPDGLYRLGMLYMTGEKNVDSSQKKYKLQFDAKRALDCFKSSQTTQALQELLKAQDEVFHPLYHLRGHVNIGKVKCLLATRFLLGDDDVDPNEKLALDLYRESAKEGYASGYTGVGYMYEHGLANLQSSMAKAIELYKKAADLGCVRAMSNLGNCYLEGVGVAPNSELAVKYLSKAASLGDQDSMQSLGLYYAKEKLLSDSNENATGSIISEPLSSARLTVNEKQVSKESIHDSESETEVTQTKKIEITKSTKKLHKHEPKKENSEGNTTKKEENSSQRVAYVQKEEIHESEDDLSDIAQSEKSEKKEINQPNGIEGKEGESKIGRTVSGENFSEFGEDDVNPIPKIKKKPKDKRAIFRTIQLIVSGILSACNILALIIVTLILACAILMYILYKEDFRFMYIPLAVFLAWGLNIFVVILGGIVYWKGTFWISNSIIFVNILVSLGILFFSFGVAGGSFVVLGIFHSNKFISFSWPWD